MSKWTKAQEYELEWWTNNDVDPRTPWWHYDSHFIHELQEKFHCVIDVGSGPVSYLYNHNVRYDIGEAIDPLIDAYYRIKKFDQYRPRIYVNTRIVFPDKFGAVPDAAFCLNMLDHVQDPIETMQKITDSLQGNGKLFLFCDLDKKTDWMHLQRLQLRWFESYVFPHFYPLVMDIEKSWRFSNDVIYYVGRKR